MGERLGANGARSPIDRNWAGLMVGGFDSGARLSKPIRGLF